MSVLLLALPLVVAPAPSVPQTVGPPAPSIQAVDRRFEPGRPPFDLPIALRFPSGTPSIVGLADFDGDQRPDAFWRDDQVGSTSMAAAPLDRAGNLLDRGWNWTLVNNPTVTFAELDPLVGDVTGDGYADIVVDRQNVNVTTGGPAGFLVRDGLAGPAPILWGASAGGSVIDWALGERAPTGGSEFVAVHAGDDQFPAMPHLRWWSFTGGSFSGGTHVVLADVRDARMPATGDLTGDGVDDVVVLVGDPILGLRVFTTLGDALVPGGVLALPPTWTASEVRVTVEDLDEDGDDDVALIGLAGDSSSSGPWYKRAPES